MGKTEAETQAKSEKAPLLMQEQASIHPYSEWAATMQAYYSSGVGIPQYFNSAMVPNHATHPYLWSPQPMIPPFGSPFPSMYPHGGGYSHPSVPIASSAQGQGSAKSSTTSEAMMGTQRTEIPSKSSSNTRDCGLMKRLKGFDGLAVSTNNGSSEDAGGSAIKDSQSGDDASENSSDGGYGINSQDGIGTHRNKTCNEDSSAHGKNGTNDMECRSNDADATKISLGVTVAHPNITGKAVVVAPLNMIRGSDSMVSASAKLKTNANTAPITGRDAIPPEHWIQDERELKRERRKQSNRESARRSRLRKQAETEELALKVDNLVSENVALKSELVRLTEISEKLRQENRTLTEKLENPVGGESAGTSCKIEAEEEPRTIGLVENLISRVNHSNEEDEQEEMDTVHENLGGKLLQILEPSGRSDAVATG